MPERDDRPEKTSAPREGALRIALPTPPAGEPLTRWLWPLLGALASLALSLWLFVQAREPRNRLPVAVASGAALIGAGYLIRKAVIHLPTVRVNFEVDGLDLTVVQHRRLGRRTVRCRLDRLQGLLVHPPTTSAASSRSDQRPRRKKRRKADVPLSFHPRQAARLLALGEEGHVLTLAAGYPHHELQQIAERLRSRCPTLPINPTLAGQPWPVAERLHVRQEGDRIAVLQTPPYGLGLAVAVVIVVGVTALLVAMLLALVLQMLGQIQTLADAWRLLPALLAACFATGLLRLGWAGVLMLLAPRRVTVGPDGVLLERLGLLGLGRSRRHWPLDRVAAISVRPRHNKTRVIGHDLAFRPAHTDVWITSVGGSPDDAASLGHVQDALERLLDECRPAVRPVDLTAVPWPGRITCQREADGVLTLRCPAPGLTMRALFPLMLGSAFVGIALVVAVNTYQDRGTSLHAAWLIVLLLLVLGLTLIGWTLVRATCHTSFRVDAAGLEVQTRSWLGVRQWQWRREEIRSILFQGSGGRWPGGWQALFTGPSDSLAVTVHVARQGGERTWHFLGLYWPGELLWCAEVLARSSGR